MGNHVGEFIGQLTALHRDERYKIVAIDQDRATQQYSTSQTRPFLEHPSIIGDCITGRKIEDRHEKVKTEPDETDEPEYDWAYVQMNVNQQSYGEQSITDDSDNVNKDFDQEITKGHEIL